MSVQAIDIYEDSFSEDSFELGEVANKKIEVVMNEKPQIAGKKHDDEEEVSSEEDESSEDDIESVGSTIDCLSKDPLFLVLSNFMSNDKGNITDALFKINKSLKKIITLLEKKH